MPPTSSLGIDLQVLNLLSLEVSPFHVIFNLNGFILATCFEVIKNMDVLP
jgi:hypothetical protein